MTVIQCDRCRSIFKDIPLAKDGVVLKRLVEGDASYLNLDLCEHCRSQLFKWFFDPSMTLRQIGS